MHQRLIAFVQALVSLKAEGAEGAEDRPILKSDRHAQMGADTQFLSRREFPGFGQFLGVADNFGQLAIDDFLAVALVQRIAAPDLEQFPALGLLYIPEYR
ncbi:MAG: hypothetical protein U5K43_14060 [Halofilum sp. (in: g-proteobacteria)]|nr:hypothetical protein [Halofilum sp. (in: g-proteobacteria)]